MLANKVSSSSMYSWIFRYLRIRNIKDIEVYKPTHSYPTHRKVSRFSSLLLRCYKNCFQLICCFWRNCTWLRHSLRSLRYHKNSSRLSSKHEKSWSQWFLFQWPFKYRFVNREMLVNNGACFLLNKYRKIWSNKKIMSVCLNVCARMFL